MGGKREKIKVNDFNGNQDSQKYTEIMMIGFKSVMTVLFLLAIDKYW
jgi:hypothetical protein